MFPAPVSGHEIGPHAPATGIELAVRAVINLVPKFRSRELMVKNGTGVAGTKLVLLGHPLWRQSRRERTRVAQLVNFPRCITVLYTVDGVIELFRAAPGSRAAVLKNLGCPEVQSGVNLGRGTLDFNEVKMGEVEFRPVLKRKPRTRWLRVELGKWWRGREWR